jgi:chemotaxis response regulator CheB
MTKRILVVEDQADLRGILRDLLTGPVEAVDGAESVAKAASQRPDLVLMDIQLPVLDGYVTRRGRSRRCPVLPRSRDPDHCREFLRHERGRREGACLRLRSYSAVDLLRQERSARRRLYRDKAVGIAASPSTRQRCQEGTSSPHSCSSKSALASTANARKRSRTALANGLSRSMAM